MEHLSSLHLDPDTTERYQKFRTLVDAVEQRHQLYLDEQESAIDACYTLELRNGTARIEINRELPFNLYEELHQCFQQSFG